MSISFLKYSPLPHLIYILFSSPVYSHLMGIKMSPPLMLSLPSVTLNFLLDSFQTSQKESLQNQDIELPLGYLVNSLKIF